MAFICCRESPMAEGSTPLLYYMPIAARGELIRMAAAIGGLKMDENADKPEDITTYGSASSVPLLKHGDLKMSQSLAIASYIASIAPLFAELTPQQRGKDMQFACIKEDVIAGFAKILFSDKNPESIKEVMAKWFPLIEGILPESGFVNGLEFPTMADLSLVILADGYMPFGAAYKIAGEDTTQYAKFTAHVERVKAFPAVAEYLAGNTTMAANPWGM